MSEIFKKRMDIYNWWIIDFLVIFLNEKFFIFTSNDLFGYNYLSWLSNYVKSFNH